MAWRTLVGLIAFEDLYYKNLSTCALDQMFVALIVDGLLSVSGRSVWTLLWVHRRINYTFIANLNVQFPGVERVEGFNMSFSITINYVIYEISRPEHNSELILHVRSDLIATSVNRNLISQPSSLLSSSKSILSPPPSQIFSYNKCEHLPYHAPRCKMTIQSLSHSH